jgi:hypothetical protein
MAVIYFFFLPVDMVPTRRHPFPQLGLGREAGVGYPVCRLDVHIPSVHCFVPTPRSYS